MYTCSKCDKNFTLSDNLRRHARNICKIELESTSQAKKIKLDSSPENMICPCCNITLPKNRMTSHTRTLQHRINSAMSISDGVILINSAFRCRVASYRFSATDAYISFQDFFRNIQQNVLEVIEDKLRVYRALKVNMEVFGQYVLQSKDVVDIKSFDTTDTVIDMGVDLSNVYKQFTDEIISQSSEFEEKDSGWATKTILFAEVNINKFSPFGGSSFIKLPHFIEKKKAIINVQNKDEYCFAWAVTSALMPAHVHPAQTSSYPHFSTILNVNGMTFPVNLKEISVFEKNNTISIHVYGLEKLIKNGNVTYEVVRPLRYAQQKLKLHVNLLYLTDDKGNGHFCRIRDLSRLLSHQINSHAHKKYFCDGCLLHFSSEAFLDIH